MLMGGGQGHKLFSRGHRERLTPALILSPRASLGNQLTTQRVQGTEGKPRQVGTHWLAHTPGGKIYTAEGPWPKRARTQATGLHTLRRGPSSALGPHGAACLKSQYFHITSQRADTLKLSCF